MAPFAAALVCAGTLAGLVLDTVHAGARGGAGAGGFPARSSCRVRGRGLFVAPDARCTPGATNPAVSQANIERTVCVAGWSERQRPPESVTEPQKRLALAAYGYYDSRALGRYELDHLIPISLGGAPNSPRNLWPEPDFAHIGPGSYDRNPKDRLEYRLYRLVCAHRLALITAQRLIAGDWLAAYRRFIGSPGRERARTPPGRKRG
jgi:hypothetical protein